MKTFRYALGVLLVLAFYVSTSAAVILMSDWIRHGQ